MLIIVNWHFMHRGTRNIQEELIISLHFIFVITMIELISVETKAKFICLVHIIIIISRILMRV